MNKGAVAALMPGIGIPADDRIAAPVSEVGNWRNHLARLVLVAGGICLTIGGIWATWAGLRDALVIFDEGILLTGSNLILGGQVPYRDFYTLYPPGVFLIIAGLWKVFGISGMIPRLFGVFLHLLTGLLAGRIAGRIAGHSFSWLACGLVLLWTSVMGVGPYASVAAMAMAFVAIELFLSVRRRKQDAWFFPCGFALGAVGCLRHDLFIYFCLALAGASVIWIIESRARLDPTFWRRAGWIALGVTIPLVLVWIPIAARAGVGVMANDLCFDQVRYSLPAVRQPMPSLFSTVPSTRFSLPIPAFLTSLFPGAVTLALLGPVFAIVSLVFGRRLHIEDRAALWTTGALALVPLTHMLTRLDQSHAILALSPALILGIGLAETLARQPVIWWRRLLIVIAALLLFACPARGILYHLKLEDWSLPPIKGRLSGLRADWDQSATLAFITQNTQPGEGIFIGNEQHQRNLANDVSLYYLSDRPGVTRYAEFDPIVARLEVQQQMVNDLEAKQVRIAVLMKGQENAEPTARPPLGARWLDDYLKKNFETVGGDNHYLWLRRKVAL